MSTRSTVPQGLTFAEHERVAANIATIKRDMPELVPFFKELHALGMVNGWRDIAYIGPTPPERGRAVSAADMVDLRVHERLREEMKRGRRQ